MGGAINEAGPHTVIRRGFFPIVTGTSVEMELAGAAAVIARGDVSIANAGAQAVLTKGAVSITNGGAQTILAGGSVDIRQGGAIVAGAKHLDVRSGAVGVVLSPHVTLTDSKLLLGPRGAFFLGAGLAVGMGLVVGARRHSRSD